jgi:hypothetical protein
MQFQIGYDAASELLLDDLMHLTLCLRLPALHGYLAMIYRRVQKMEATLLQSYIHITWADLGKANYCDEII